MQIMKENISINTNLLTTVPVDIVYYKHSQVLPHAKLF